MVIYIVFTLNNTPSGINLRMHPANEWHHYNVTSSIIGWVHSQTDPCPLHVPSSPPVLFTTIALKVSNVPDISRNQLQTYKNTLNTTKKVMWKYTWRWYNTGVKIKLKKHPQKAVWNSQPPDIYRRIWYPKVQLQRLSHDTETIHIDIQKQNL